ncbi:MAG: DUF418 domain-containing protein, partial [Gemmataceae bacterium]|nr:DUF418 domain-containing protein [Gemmataceae bacterium]
MADQNRLSSLDLIRGVAVLGILPANLATFLGAPVAGATPADRAAESLVLLVISMKMMTTLSILFGAGLAVQEAARRPGDGFPLRYFWRQSLLFLLGVAHGVLIWFGDILASYACVGTLAMILLLLGPGWARAVLIAGLAWFYLVSAVILAVVLAFPGLGQQESERPPLSPDGPPLPLLSGKGPLEEQVADYFSDGNQARIHRHGTFAQRTANRALVFSVVLLTMPFLFGWYVLGCFLIGTRLVRAGFFHDPEKRRPLARRFLALGVGIGLPLHVAGALLHWFYPTWPLPGLLNVFGALPQALLYLALLMAWDASGAWPWLQERLRAVGRMALTNYLMQSVLFVALFDGLGWYGSVGLAAGTGLVA